jgi:hypothetical protein
MVAEIAERKGNGFWPMTNGTVDRLVRPVYIELQSTIKG